MIGVLIWRLTLIIREVQSCDHIELIELLKEDFGKDVIIDFDEFDIWLGHPHNHTFVGIINGEIVATYTILLEYKLIHKYGVVAHGEDLVVRTDHRGKGVAKSMMDYALEFCKQHGCYKFITTVDNTMVDYFNNILGTKECEVSLMRYF